MKYVLTLALAGLLLSAPALLAEDQPVTKADLPSAIIKAFETANPGAVVTEYGKETVDGKVRFEIEIKITGGEKDFVYLADGTLLQTEEDMPIKDLPKSVSDALKKAYPKGEIDEADKIIRGATIEYQVGLEVGDTEYELVVTSDGTIISRKTVADHDNEAEDNDSGDEEDND